MEALTGICPADQTLTHQGQALDGRYRLTDFPAVHNRSTLVLADSNPRRNQVAAAQGAAAGAAKMKANSVLSMSKMFQAGQIPGGSLSALQEDSYREKKQLQKSVGAFRSSGSFGKQAGLDLTAGAHGNLLARAQRAKQNVRGLGGSFSVPGGRVLWRALAIVL